MFLKVRENELQGKNVLETLEPVQLVYRLKGRRRIRQNYWSRCKTFSRFERMRQYACAALWPSPLIYKSMNNISSHDYLELVTYFVALKQFEVIYTDFALQI